MNGLPELKELMEQAFIDFSVVTYPDAGHAFFNDTNPYAYDEAAAKDVCAAVPRFSSPAHGLEDRLINLDYGRASRRLRQPTFYPAVFPGCLPVSSVNLS